ncbi:MAG: hypothetical protein EGR89_01070 [[Eubacterium] rectale]|jgi:hypothetical protein|nr:hypothetical protein [Agathobacter rectalis]
MKDKKLQTNELKIDVIDLSFSMGIISLYNEKKNKVTLLSIILNTRHILIRIDAPLPINTLSVSIFAL